MKFARIIPLGNKEKWSKRTFDISGWPFMIHIAGKTTGCIAIQPRDWSSAQEALNEAYKSETFTIRVTNV